MLIWFLKHIISYLGLTFSLLVFDVAPDAASLSDCVSRCWTPTEALTVRRFLEAVPIVDVILADIDSLVPTYDEAAAP